MSDTRSNSLRFDATDKLLLSGLLAALSVVLLALGETWWNSDHMSHGFLVPIVSYFVVSSRAGELAALSAQRDSRGILAVAVGLVLAFGGVLGATMTVAGVGVVVSLVGLLWLRRGWAWVIALAFPLAYLLFMVPPPEEWHRPLVVWLQGWASEWSVAALYRLEIGRAHV